MEVMMVVSSRKRGSLRLRGLRILGANRCASGRTLGGTEPVIRKSGNWCSAPATLSNPLFSRYTSLKTRDADSRALGPGCTPGYVHMRPSRLFSFEPGNCWC